MLPKVPTPKTVHTTGAQIAVPFKVGQYAWIRGIVIKVHSGLGGNFTCQLFSRQEAAEGAIGLSDSGGDDGVSGGLEPDAFACSPVISQDGSGYLFHFPNFPYPFESTGAKHGNGTADQTVWLRFTPPAGTNIWSMNLLHAVPMPT